MPSSPMHHGGSFAPPVEPGDLDDYERLAQDAATPEARDAMLSLTRMVRTFQETGPSPRPGTPHPSGRGTVVPLEKAEVDRIFDVVPWRHELQALGGHSLPDGTVVPGVFDKLPDSTPRQKSVRNAAFHLLWYGYELVADREPCTTDRL